LSTPYSGLGGIPYGAIASYGTLNLTASSPPQSFVEPLTLADMKSFLNLPPRSPVDNSEDAQINAFISGARNQAEIMQGRDLVVKQWDLSLDYFFKYQIELRPSLQSVDLVTYRDRLGNVYPLIQNVDYIVDASKQPGLITPKYNVIWPSFVAWPTSAVLVRFTAGLTSTDPFWSDIGQLVKNGMRLLISAWFNNRLPFELGSGVVDEYPYTVTNCLRAGGLSRAR
jgi:uncharacterized phiE125 gp8 family phage protein